MASGDGCEGKGDIEARGNGKGDDPGRGGRGDVMVDGLVDVRKVVVVEFKDKKLVALLFRAFVDVIGFFRRTDPWYSEPFMEDRSE